MEIRFIGWLVGLSAGVDYGTLTDFALFNIDMELTETGISTFKYNSFIRF